MEPPAAPPPGEPDGDGLTAAGRRRGVPTRGRRLAEAGAQYDAPRGAEADGEPADSAPREEAQKAVKLLLVSEFPVSRAALKALLASAPQFTVVGEAATPAETAAAVDRLEPDVLLVSVCHPDPHETEAWNRILAGHPRTRCIVLACGADQQTLLAAIQAGASGYLLKRSEPERLIQAVETVARGGSVLDPPVAETALQWMRHHALHAAHDPLARLTQQERSLLPLIAAGRTNREIAEALSVSEHTVKTHVAHILRKLGLTRRIEVAAFLIQHDHRTDSRSRQSG